MKRGGKPVFLMFEGEVCNLNFNMFLIVLVGNPTLAHVIDKCLINDTFLSIIKKKTESDTKP